LTGLPAGLPAALLAGLAVYLLLSAVRLGLAWRFATRADAAIYNGHADVTIVQAILSGDPGLAACLAKNVLANPEAQFIWLVDNDDIEGQRIARELAARFRDRAISISTGPGPRDGENPKLAKLARAEGLVTSAVLLVLDDDTVLPAGGAMALARLAADGNLATGVPVYSSAATFAERLVSGFINGQALPTYFSFAEVGANRTINGMVYALRTDDLRSFGGFAAAGHEITDDYAVARLWQSHGRKLVQSRVYAEVRITFPSLGAAAKVLRRWFIFANRYLTKNLSAATLGLVVAPSLLPLLTLIMAIGAGWRGVLLWLSVMALKACATGLLLRRSTGRPLRLLSMACEIAADALAPVIYLSAFVRPSRVTWRTRRIDTSHGTIRYR
jgi:ceramide glucosyltransferase